MKGEEKSCVLLNVGSSADHPIKASLIEGLIDEAIVTPIEIRPNPAWKTMSFCEVGQDVTAQLNGKRLKVNFVLFRCPVLRENIQGITPLTRELITDFDSKIALKHNSEIAMWTAWFYGDSQGVPAIFSRGIPTSRLPEFKRYTGHPEIKNSCFSHWETVEGVAMHEGIDVFLLVMLGGGNGIYGWENNGISAYKIRQWDGPMSLSSIGAIDTLSLLDHFLGRGETDLKEVRNEIGNLAGKTGGLQMYKPEWGDLKKFREDVEKDNPDPLAKTLFQNMVYQIAGKMGEVNCLMESKIQKPVFFFGGGANWPYLRESIIDRFPPHFFYKFENVDYDPEMEFFISQAKEFAATL